MNPDKRSLADGCVQHIGNNNKVSTTTSLASRRHRHLDVVNVLLLQSLDKVPHLLDTAVTDLLEVLAQTVLYLVLQTRLLAASRHKPSTHCLQLIDLQRFDTVDWATGRASRL